MQEADSRERQIKRALRGVSKRLRTDETPPFDRGQRSTLGPYRRPWETLSTAGSTIATVEASPTMSRATRRSERLDLVFGWGYGRVSCALPLSISTAMGNSMAPPGGCASGRGGGRVRSTIALPMSTWV
jgi:hypothetical protein